MWNPCDTVHASRIRFANLVARVLRIWVPTTSIHNKRFSCIRIFPNSRLRNFLGDFSLTITQWAEYQTLHSKLLTGWINNADAPDFRLAGVRVIFGTLFGIIDSAITFRFLDTDSWSSSAPRLPDTKPCRSKNESITEERKDVTMFLSCIHQILGRLHHIRGSEYPPQCELRIWLVRGNYQCVAWVWPDLRHR